MELEKNRIVFFYFYDKNNVSKHEEFEYHILIMLIKSKYITKKKIEL